MLCADEKLELITSVADLGIADWDIASDDYVFNARYCELLGYLPGALKQNHAVWLATLHPENREIVQGNLRNHLENQTPFDVECRVKTKNGDYRWFRFRGQATFNGQKIASHMITSMCDVSARKEVELEITRTRIQLKNLTLRALERQETERKSIARELHDEIGQVLTVIKLNLQRVARSSEGAPVATQLNDSIKLLGELAGQVRNLSRLLRPPQLDALGLQSALTAYVENRAAATGMSIHLSCDPSLVRLQPDLETNCFRIVQECLTNVFRHAQAQHVSIELRRYDDTVLVGIKDDGIGFDMIAVRKRTRLGECLGLFGIEERAHLLGGEVTICSRMNEGTNIQVTFPILLAKPRSRTNPR